MEIESCSEQVLAGLNAQRCVSPGMRRVQSVSEDYSDFFSTDEDAGMRSTRSSSFSSNTSKFSDGSMRMGRSATSKHVLNPGRYKTEMCRQYLETKNCKYGKKCQFAHGQEDVRGLNRHPKYKTEFCRTFHMNGFCPYGPRCHFIHSEDDIQLDKIRKMKQRQMYQQLVEALQQQNLVPAPPVAAVPVFTTPVIPVRFVPVEVPLGMRCSYPLDIPCDMIPARPPSLGSDGSPTISPVGSPDFLQGPYNLRSLRARENLNGFYSGSEGAVDYGSLKRLPVFSQIAANSDE